MLKYIDLVINYGNTAYCYDEILYKLHKMGWTWNSGHSLLEYQPGCLNPKQPLRIILIPDDKKVAARNLIFDDMDVKPLFKHLEINIVNSISF